MKAGETLLLELPLSCPHSLSGGAVFRIHLGTRFCVLQTLFSPMVYMLDGRARPIPTPQPHRHLVEGKLQALPSCLSSLCQPVLPLHAQHTHTQSPLSEASCKLAPSGPVVHKLILSPSLGRAQEQSCFRVSSTHSTSFVEPYS